MYLAHFIINVLADFLLILLNDPVLIVFQLCFRDICQGMSYLEERKIVHRWVVVKVHVWVGTQSMSLVICFVKF